MVVAYPDGSSYAGTYPYTAKGYLPDGSVTQFSFNLDIGCVSPTITSPTYDSLKTATLGNTSDNGSYEIPFFTVAPSDRCSITYTI